MNTFLVSNSFAQCARVLDMQRLSRQIVECCQVARCLKAYDELKSATGRLPFGVIFPPVIKLWLCQTPISGSNSLIPELCHYFDAMCYEWNRLHSKSHATQKTFSWDSVGGFKREPFNLIWPDSVYFSHRSRLILKDPSHYYNALARENLDDFINLEKYMWKGPMIQEDHE